MVREFLSELGGLKNKQNVVFAAHTHPSGTSGSQRDYNWVKNYSTDLYIVRGRNYIDLYQANGTAIQIVRPKWLFWSKEIKR